MFSCQFCYVFQNSKTLGDLWTAASHTLAHWPSIFIGKLWLLTANNFCKKALKTTFYEKLCTNFPKSSVTIL